MKELLKRIRKRKKGYTFKLNSKGESRGRYFKIEFGFYGFGYMTVIDFGLEDRIRLGLVRITLCENTPNNCPSWDNFEII